MFRDTRVHVVIPAYNVAPHLEAVLRGVPDYVDTVTVVDDASTDDTAEVAKGVGDPRVTVLGSPVNEGVGGAMARGFEHALALRTASSSRWTAMGRWIRPTCRGSSSPSSTGAANTPRATASCGAASSTSCPRRASRETSSDVSHCSPPATGTSSIRQNGYVAITSGTLRLLDLGRLSRRYFFENDMLINLNIFDARVGDVAMPARYGAERSSMRLGRILCSFPFHLFRGYWYRFYRKHVLRDFSPVALFMLTGLPLLAWGTGFGLYTWGQSWLQNQFASTGTVMLSVLPFLVGFELVLQALVLEIRDTPR